MARFVQAWCGGDMLEDIIIANRSLSFTREVPPTFFGKLVKVRYSTYIVCSMGRNWLRQYGGRPGG